MTAPGLEEVINKIRDLEAAHAHLREEISLFNALGRGRMPPRWAPEGPETPMQSVVPRDRTLELMESYYMRILESMGQAVIAYNLDRRIFYWNKHAEKLFDCSREDALGNDVLSILVNPNLHGVASGVINGVKQGMSWTGQFPVELQTGKKLLVIVSVDPFYDDDATLVGLVVVAVDSKPFFEIKYSVSDQTFRPSRTILAPKQPLKTAIASKLTSLAAKVRSKVRSRMKTSERDVSRAGGSGDSHISVHGDFNNEDDGASTPKKDIISSFGTFFKDVISYRESIDEGEEKNDLHKIDHFES